MKKERRVETGHVRGGWRQWTESQARAELSAFRRSGQSAPEFARSRGISANRLWYWSKRIGSERKASAEAIEFVPLAVQSEHSAGQLEIESAGVVVRVRESLDVEHVARLVSALRAKEGPC